METIQNYHRYTELMKNGFYDKLFFIDKLFGNWNGIFDYGCADGFLTKLIAELFPDKRIVGYDNNKHMIDTAKYTGSYPENVSFTSKQNPEELLDVVLLSSVIHEIYSYYKKEDILTFWDYIFSTGKFKKIIIRDMIPDDRSYSGVMRPNAGRLTKIREWFGRNQYTGDLKRFETLWGPLESGKSYTHLLLKYPYIESPNWEREIKENYLALTLQELQCPTGWRVAYQECCALPYLANKWYEDFGITTPPKTHTKLILEKL